MGSSMFLIPKDKIRIYSEATGTVSALNDVSKKEKGMAANNSWTGYETWAQVFLVSKSARKTVHVCVIVR